MYWKLLRQILDHVDDISGWRDKAPSRQAWLFNGGDPKCFKFMAIEWISYGARDPLLSDKRLFPNFFRTVPDDKIQISAIVKLLEKLRWDWVGIITSDDDSGRQELQMLLKEFTDHQICVEFRILVSMENYKDVPQALQTSSTDVIIICGTYTFSRGQYHHCSDAEKNTPMKYNGSDDTAPYQVYTAVYIMAQALHKSLLNNDGKHDTWRISDYRRRIPNGRCSESCLPGTRKVLREGYHICCYDCIPCAEGEFTNHSDSQNCRRCPEDEWPNERRNKCYVREQEYLSYETDVLALVFSIFSMLLSLISVFMMGIFTIFWKSPIVRANNRTLSFILLSSLMFSLLCVFLFIGRPVDMTCMLRQTFFGIFFTVVVSSVLAKTIIVCIAFKATRPDSPWRKCVGVKLPYSVVLGCSSIQVVNAVIWLSVSPPYQEYNRDYPGKTIIQCNEGSVLSFYLMLGYLGFLAAVSFVLAFMVRTLPDIYNEAKYITFSMLLFCSVWICAIPAYLSSRGKYMVIVEIFAILSSGGGILCCMFIPKCYNILVNPEVKSKGHRLQKHFT
ncbi:vomeronasal type-2 receptor 26-like [Engystomops pustulosus]|uniref:vomeronasal type-2 receptor 26-like n=1 Tax=Engystomops pustulosus TaxID=76066 RepID=UPI003AFA380D